MSNIVLLRTNPAVRYCALSALLMVCFSNPSHAQAPTTIYNGHPAVEGEILVRLRTVDAATVARVQGVLPADLEPLIPALGVHLVRVPGQSVSDLMQAFSAHPDVLYAEPNYIVEAVATPNDPFYSLLYGLTKIAAPAAWDLTTGTTSAVIGVVDTGVDYTHSDLAANVWSAPAPFTVTIAGVTINCPAGSHGFNAITKTCDPLDDHDHGTHVSGTIGGTGNNGVGVAGVNWTASIMGLKFLSASGSGSIADAISAIQFAIQVKAAFAGTATPVDVRVLSNSWGGGGFSQSLLDAINLANSNGMLFVVAAGNSAADTEARAFYPANYTAPNVISIAATDSADALASFSNYGAATVHVGAPGVGIYSTIRSDSYASFSGTSMATPHVAGAALLTLAACPALTASDLKRALQNNTDPDSFLTGKTITGGRLNVAKMVQGCRASSVNPASGRGSNQTFTFVASDKDGASDITYVRILFNTTLVGTNACSMYFTPSLNQLLLRDSADTSWLGPVTLGQPGSLSNNQCTVNAAGSSSSSSGNALTVSVALSFLPGFEGPKTNFMIAYDSGGGSSWQTVGSWTVPVAAGSNQSPSSASVRASSGAGAGRTFSYRVLDANGGEDIATTHILINSSLNGANACYIQFAPASRQLWLRDSADTSWLGPATMGVSALLNNGACTLYPGGSSSWTSGNALTVNVLIAFTGSSFAGLKQNYFMATDYAGGTTNWQQVGTWNVNTPPQPLSVTPSSGSGFSQTFSYVISDANGATDINYATVLINGSFNFTNACYLFFYRGSQQLWLLNDANTGYLGPVTLGTAGSLSNSQCTINAGNSSLSSAGTLLTANLGLTFSATFAGIKYQYAQAVDSVGGGSGFYWYLGTWTVPSNQPPTADSVTPASGTGNTQTLALQYSDPAGATNLATTWVWFNATLASSSANSCLVYYAPNPPTSWLIYLLNDAGTAWLSATIGAAGTTLQNSQCAITVGSSSAVTSGNTLTLNLAMAFKPAFYGTKNIYMFAANRAGANSGWQDRGDWTVPGVIAVVTADSVTPASGSGVSQTFALQYSDTLGAADLSTTWVWFNPTLASSAANSCLVYYNRASNTVFLLNDAAAQWTSAVLGSSTTLENSQCTIAVGSGSAVPSGNTLTVNLAMAFKLAFAGTKNTYMFAASAGGANSAWQDRGDWTVPGGGVPTADSVTPASGSGSSQPFALQYSDTAGATNLALVWMWVSQSQASSASSCLVHYDRAANMVLLLNDAGSAWMSATLGVVTTLQNSQCAVAVGSSSATPNGTTLTLNLAMTFLPAYAGVKNIFMYASNGTANSGWQDRGDWIVP